VTQRLIRAFAGAVILAAFAAPAAQAGDSFLVASNTKFADGLVDPNGTLRVRATMAHGSSIRLRARAFIKVKRGRSPRKSLFVTFRVCP